MTNALKGNHYHFTEDGLTHKDYPHLVPYTDITEVSFSLRSRTVFVRFAKHNSAATKKVEVYLDKASDTEVLKAFLLKKMPDAKIHTRQQTTIEACKSSSLLMLGLCLLGLIAIVLVVNLVGRARVPVILLPLISIGAYIGTAGILIVAAVIALVCAVAAATAIAKKGGTCVITQAR